MTIQAVSVVPGRVRFRVPHVKHNHALARQWEDRLRAVEGVHRVHANPTTGSLLIHYHEEAVDLQALLDTLLGQETAGKIDWPTFLEAAAKVAEDVLDPNDAFAHAVHSAVNRVNAALESATGGVNLRTLAPWAFVVFGVSDLLLSKRVERPPWFTLFWYALSSFHTYSMPPEVKKAHMGEPTGTLIRGAG